MTVNPEELVEPTLDTTEVLAPSTSKTWRYGRLPYGLIAPSVVVLLLVLAWPISGSLLRVALPVRPADGPSFARASPSAARACSSASPTSGSAAATQPTVAATRSWAAWPSRCAC